MKGLCECGCGERTNLASRNSKQFGWVKGEPLRFRLGHASRGGVAYIEQDCGYTTPCWVWQLGKDDSGYGRSRRRSAHRVYYENHVGPIPPGLHLDHLCVNPPCVNPDHLEPVTPELNVRRSRKAKLSVEKAAEVRASSLTQVELAAIYGVTQTAISDVVRGRTWR